MGVIMKKVLVILICLFLLVGCDNGNKEEKVDTNNEEKFIVEKIDVTKDYVYFNKYKELKLGGNDYSLDILVINIKGDDIDNVNLELKSFVNKSYRNMEIYEGEISQGNIVSYEYYKTDKYLSILQKYYIYIDGIIGDECINFYTISLDTGKVMSNNMILDDFEITEEELFKKIEDGIDTEDVSYTMMNIKKDGYYLYINSNEDLVVSYYEVDDENIMRKDFVL